MLLLMPAAADDLITVYRQALKSDPTFRAADAAYLAALETRPQSLAVLLPDLSATGSLSRERFDPRNTGPTTYATNQTYALGLRQPVFRRDRFIQLEQADSRVAQADAEYVAARQDLIIRVATAYFLLLGTQDNLAFVRADKLALTRTLDQAQQRFEVGLAAITDSLKAQAAYDIAVSDEISAEQLLADAREALRELTGTLPEQPEILQPDIPLLAPEPASDEKWVAAAGEQNPLVLAARAAATTAREEVRVQQSGHYPTLDLTANYAYRDSSFGGIAQQERNDSRVGLELNLPIYQGGLVTSQTRQSRYLYNQAMEEQAKQQRAVERQTRDDYRGVISGISRVNALQRAIQSNEKAYEAAQSGFEVGTRDIIDVLDAQRELLRARRDHARSRYDYLLDTLRLRQAAGILEEADLVQINEWLVENKK
ncbi:MAG: TolC family outer membrane protein [Halobacteria archaeon]|nr:TolC family outer membrane protein [Halobacteria archaeon]